MNVAWKFRSTHICNTLAASVGAKRTLKLDREIEKKD